MKTKTFLTGALSTNCYLVWEEESSEAMVIDPGAYEPAIMRTIEENSLQLKYIALTHGHGDHIGGVPKLQEAFPGTLLVMGEKDAALAGDMTIDDTWIFFEERVVLEPDLLLKDGNELSLGGLSFLVRETPGHTPGGLSFYVEECDAEQAEQSDQYYSGTVFTGDTLFNASVGRTDLPGGDFATLSESIRGVLFELPEDTLVLPGHMGATSIGFEKQYNPFIK